MQLIGWYERAGKRFDKPLASAREAIAQVGGDFDVETAPVQIADGTLVPNAQAVINKSTGLPLACVGSDYQAIPFADIGDAFDAGIAGQVEWTHGGMFDNGCKVWLRGMVRGAAISINGHLAINRTVFAKSSHDGSLVALAHAMPEGIHCLNQMAYAKLFGIKTSVCVRHSGVVSSKLTQIRGGIADILTGFDDYAAFMQALAAKQLTGNDVADLLKVIVPDTGAKRNTRTENMRERILALTESGAGVQELGIQGSALSVLYALTQYRTHEVTGRVEGKGATVTEAMRSESRAKSLTIGGDAEWIANAIGKLSQAVGL